MAQENAKYCNPHQRPHYTHVTPPPTQTPEKDQQTQEKGSDLQRNGPNPCFVTNSPVEFCVELKKEEEEEEDEEDHHHHHHQQQQQQERGRLTLPTLNPWPYAFARAVNIKSNQCKPTSN
jgi:hypothetical protein